MHRFQMIASVYLLFIKDGQILLQKRINTGFEDGKYGVPSGHVEKDETLTEAFCREMREEIGLEIRQENVKLVQVMHRLGTDERLGFFFTIKDCTTKLQNMEPDKCEELRWFPVNGLAENTIKYIRKAIGNYENGIFYDEFGWQ